MGEIWHGGVELSSPIPFLHSTLPFLSLSHFSHPFFLLRLAPSSFPLLPFAVPFLPSPPALPRSPILQRLGITA